MAAQCLQSAQKGLQEAGAGEFDMHYIGAQILAHQGMVDMLTVIARHASPELQQTLEQGQQTVQAHLDEAKQIKEQLMTAATSQPREPKTN
jgi:predicted outer membrane protein